MYQPLVTVGIPTYNRPEGLKRTLENITRQSYDNIEIIVSNNGSTNSLVDAIINDFLQVDKRIIYFKQPINKGPVFNFKFVLEKASGSLFMWAADDDYFESNNLLEKLVEKCANKLLVFPDFNLSGPDDVNLHVLDPVYKKCVEKLAYLKAWSKSGAGYPVYGLYNIPKLKEANIEFDFNSNLLYYTEGILLHKIFIKGDVEFVPDIFIRIDNSSSRPDNLRLAKYFYAYCNKTFILYFSSRVVNRFQILRNIFINYRSHFQTLFAKIKNEYGYIRSSFFLLNKPIFLLFTFSVIVNKIRRKARALF